MTPTQRENAVKNAVRRGKLPPANTERCIYCGHGATMYRCTAVHPLTVTPMCHRCHKRHALD